MVWWGNIVGTAGRSVGTGPEACSLPSGAHAAVGAILAFSAGVMLSIVFLELLQESMAYSGHAAALAGLFLGMGIFYLLDHYLPHHHPVNPKATSGRLPKKESCWPWA